MLRPCPVEKPRSLSVPTTVKGVSLTRIVRNNFV